MKEGLNWPVIIRCRLAVAWHLLGVSVSSCDRARLCDVWQNEVVNARAEGARAYSAQLESLRLEREFLAAEMDKARAERNACKEQMGEVSGLNRSPGGQRWNPLGRKVLSAEVKVPVLNEGVRKGPDPGVTLLPSTLCTVIWAPEGGAGAEGPPA